MLEVQKNTVQIDEKGPKTVSSAQVPLAISLQTEGTHTSKDRVKQYNEHNSKNKLQQEEVKTKQTTKRHMLEYTVNYILSYVERRK